MLTVSNTLNQPNCSLESYGYDVCIVRSLIVKAHLQAGLPVTCLQEAYSCFHAACGRTPGAFEDAVV